MNNRVLIMAIYDTVVKNRGSGREVDALIASVIGWTGIEFFVNTGAHLGIPPGGKNHAYIPCFSTSVDGALLLCPDRWVESYRRRHDNTIIVELHPRGDLKMENVTAYSDNLIVGLIDAFLTARLQMIMEQDL